jgi:hypothetical protein
MAVMILGEFQLGADSVRSGHEKRFAQASWKAHEAAKSAKTSHDFWAVGGLYRSFDALNKSPSSFYINTCTLVVHGLNPVS